MKTIQLTNDGLRSLIREGIKEKLNTESKPSAGLTKKQKSDTVKKAKAGKDIGKKGKNFKEIEAKAKKSGATDPAAVAGAVLWKNIKRK